MIYSTVLNQRYDPTIEQEGEQFEILMSNDFENMDLEQLVKIEKRFTNLMMSVENRSALYTHDSLEKARDFLWFRLKQEKNKNDCVKVGDIFHTSWGYDQTNVEYFKIVKISPTGKTCDIVQIGFETVKGSEGFMSDAITPTPEVILNDGKTCKVKIERSTEYHPYKKQRQQIGEINLRGSVFYASGYEKHLQNLYRVDPTKRESRSWYA